MRRGPRIALISVAAVAAVGGLVTYGAYQYFRTAAGSAFLLARAKSIAASYGVQLSFAKGEVDPFSYLRFADLKIIKGAGDDRLELFVKRIDVKYRLSLLARRIEVEHANVLSPAVFFRHIARVDPEPASPAESPGAVESTRRFLSSPPIKVKVAGFLIQGLSVDAEMRAPSNGVAAKIDSASMKGSLELAGAELKIDAEAELSEKSLVKLFLKTAGPESRVENEIELEPFATMKLGAELRQRDGKWRYEVKPSAFTLGTRRVSFLSITDAKRQTGKLGAIRLQSDLKLKAASKELLTLDRDSLSTLDSTSRLTIDPGSFENTRVGPQKAMVTLGLGEAVEAKLLYTLSEIVSRPILRAPARLEAKAEAHLAKDFTKTDANGVSSLNGIEFASFRASSQTSNGVTFEAKANASLSAKLLALLQPSLGAKAAGVVRADAALAGKIEGTFASFADLTAPALSEAPANLKATFDLVQENKRGATFVFEPFRLETTLHREKNDTKFAGFLNSDAGRFEKNSYRGLAIDWVGNLDAARAKVKVASGLGELKSGSLQKAITPSLTANLDWAREEGKIVFEASTLIDAEEAARLKGSSRAGNRKHLIEASLDASFGEYVAAFFPKKQWDELGRWKSKTALTLEVEMPATAGAPFAENGIVRGGGSTVVSQTQAAEAKGRRLLMTEPVEITHRFDFDRGKKNAELTAEIPSVELEGTAKVTGTRAKATVRAANPSQPTDSDIEGSFQQGEILISEDLSREQPTLQGVDASFKANVRGGGDRFTLESLTASFNRKMLKLTAEASGRLKTKDFQMSGKLVAEVPKSFPPIADQQIHGRVELPWTASVLRGREVSLEGDLSLTDVSWAKGIRRVSGITGKLPLSEKFILEEGKLRFAYLIDQNPFERVDFERIRPLITRTDQVRIQQIGFEEKNYGPFVGFFSMRQNLIFAHQFDFTVGASGLAYGELYFNIYPDNLQLGFLARLTALNLEEVLPKKYLVKVPKGDKNLSGRTALVVNLNRGTVDGRIDITEIGASQLITMINALDPKFEDEKMNMARTALGVGYPTFVQMVLQKGYLDMGVDVTALGISQRFDVRGIPVSTWVSAATSGIVKKTQEAPLK